MTTTTSVRGITHREVLDSNPRAGAVYGAPANEWGPGHGSAAQLELSVGVRSVEEFPHLRLEHLAPTIGTVAHGLDITRVNAAEVGFLRQLLNARKVIFFRKQQCDERQHIAFGKHFGELEIHPFNPMHIDHDEIIPVYSGKRSVGGANRWHSDVMWRMQPSLGSILRAKVVPELGGDTLFADMGAAYRGLSADVRAQITGLMALNSGSANGSKEKARHRLEERGATAQKLANFDHTYAHIPIPLHPVVRTHPETGERILYVNGSFTRRICGLDEGESKALLNHLIAQAAIPEYQCRFRWAPDSVAFWDNRACQHYASSDYWPAKRQMDRVTVAGDLPFFRDDDGNLTHTVASDITQ